MSKRATDGALLDELVALSIPVCQEAERMCPRRGPGRKPTIPDWVIAVMILVAVLLKKKTKSAQFRWWCEHRADFARWLPEQPFPGRSTFFDRYRRVHGLFRAGHCPAGPTGGRRGLGGCPCVAGDKSLIAGLGRRWDSRDRRRGRVPRRVDTDTTWGYSQHDGWVQGYSFEVVVTAPAEGVSWPLVASADTASRSEQKTILDKIPELPRPTRYVLPMRVTTATRLASWWSGTGSDARAGVGCARKSRGPTRAGNASRTTAKRENGNVAADCAMADDVLAVAVGVDPSTRDARRASSRSTPN